MYAMSGVLHLPFGDNSRAPTRMSRGYPQLAEIRCFPKPAAETSVTKVASSVTAAWEEWHS